MGNNISLREFETTKEYIQYLLQHDTEKIGLKVLKLKTYFESIIDKLMRVYEMEEILFDSHRNNVARCICLYRE